MAGIPPEEQTPYGTPPPPRSIVRIPASTWNWMWIILLASWGWGVWATWFQ